MQSYIPVLNYAKLWDCEQETSKYYFEGLKPFQILLSVDLLAINTETKSKDSFNCTQAVQNMFFQRLNNTGIIGIKQCSVKKMIKLHVIITLAIINL